MATIKDVARLAGVGLGTASRVISGRGSVSPATLEKVRKAIEELEFRPSHAARSLLSGSSRMVGVYLPCLDGSVYHPVLHTIHGALRAEGLNMVVAFGMGSGDPRRQAVDGVNFLVERGSDGVIALDAALDDADIAALGAFQSRVVLINQMAACIAEQCFTVDHGLGGRLAARALLARGHRQIAFFSAGAAGKAPCAAGFMAELAAAGIGAADVWRADGAASCEGGWTCAEALLASGGPFTALFCANDEMALGALSYFQQAGVAVPRQVSVLGYDDSRSAAFTAPRLSTVHVPWSELTLNGLNFLLNRCYRTARPVARGFAPTLAERASLAEQRGHT